MISKEVKIINKTGLHARPASTFVMKASEFSSNITVIKDHKEYNAKSLISLLSMGASKGDTIVIQADGVDEEIAVNDLYELMCTIED